MLSCSRFWNMSSSTCAPAKHTVKRERSQEKTGIARLARRHPNFGTFYKDYAALFSYRTGFVTIRPTWVPRTDRRSLSRASDLHVQGPGFHSWGSPVGGAICIFGRTPTLIIFQANLPPPQQSFGCSIRQTHTYSDLNVAQLDQDATLEAGWTSENFISGC